MIRNVVLLILGVLCIFAGEASSQVFLEEGKVNLAVSGGEHINKSLLIHNTSGENVEVKVYWEDFTYQAPYDGTKLFSPSGAGAGSAGTWINFSPQHLTLPPYGKQKVDYSLTIPAKIDQGHYGSLFFERGLGPMKDNTGVNLVTRVGCLFFIDPKNRSKKVALEGMSPDRNGIKGTFINQGNVIIIPRMTYYIMDDAKLVVDRGELKKLYMPPGASAEWTIPLPKDLKPSHYTLMINADLEGGDLVVKEIGIEKDTSGLIKINQVWD